MKKIFAAVFGLLFFIFNALCSAYAPEGRLYVSMLDVGQGDAFLVETPTQNVLIDSGDVAHRQQLVDMLQEAGVERLELVILSHPHADHIGGLKAVLDNFIVEQIADNGYSSSSPLYKQYRAVDVKFSSLRAGDILNLGGGVKFKVLWPSNLIKLGSVNNQSVVGKLTFGDFAILFTGDAEQPVEEFLLGEDLKATILKAGHHGSKSSSSSAFIHVVAPDYVFISAGKNNLYGHPHRQALAAFQENFVLPENIFCTAFNGSARVETDGKNHIIIVERAADWVVDYSREIITVTRLD